MIDVVTVSSTNFVPASNKLLPYMKIFKPSTLVSLAIAIAAALVTQPVRATAISTLVITENSSDSLTALLNGTTYLSVTTNFSGDNWTIALMGVSTSLPGGSGQSWFEPDAAGFINRVSFDSNVPNKLFVLSDFGPGFTNGLANNTADTTDFFLNGSLLSVTFFDKGDVATAPDTGSTLGLLSLSVVALLGATHLRFLQLAA